MRSDLLAFAALVFAVLFVVDLDSLLGGQALAQNGVTVGTSGGSPYNRAGQDDQGASTNWQGRDWDDVTDRVEQNEEMDNSNPMAGVRL